MSSVTGIPVKQLRTYSDDNRFVTCGCECLHCKYKNCHARCEDECSWKIMLHQSLRSPRVDNMDSERERIKKNCQLAERIVRRKKKPTDSKLVQIHFSVTCRCETPTPDYTGRRCQKCGGRLFSKLKEMACFCPYRTEYYQTLCRNKKYPQKCKVKSCLGMMLDREDVKHFLGIVDLFYKTYKNEHDEK